MAYLLNTLEQEQELLAFLGLKNLEDLYAHFPKELIIDGLNIPKALGEMQILKLFEDYAAQNTVFSSIFRGAGAYRHYIPAVVPEMVNKERFKTGYTPYQAEVSQGVLQSIFEFQTMICELMGMDAANASVYDGATAAAEAFAMTRQRKKNRLLVLETVSPRIFNVVSTYAWAADSFVSKVPHKNYKADLNSLEAAITDDVSAILVQQPNFYGIIEDISDIVQLAHSKKIQVIVHMNPIAAAVLESPGFLGADIAVGEGQPLGLPLSYGGPYVGFMATKASMTRKLPGRIVGQTQDNEGRRAFVLTLQAREQHIRRETAGSNICTNQALCAIATSVYMAAMGPQGLKEVALQSYSKAHYLADELAKIGINRLSEHEFFHEFITNSPKDYELISKKLQANGILGGLELKCGNILWCATEMNSKQDIDTLIEIIRGEI